MTRRLNALVIGNAAYAAGGELKNPVNDAQDVAAVLEGCGFTVIRLVDSTRAAMDRKLKEFKTALKESDVGLFFFAGHGMQIDGDNYLAPIDTDWSDETEAKHSSLALDRVIDSMDKSGVVTSIVILDACRNNLPSSVHGRGRNGDYTAALLQHMATPDCTVETMFKRVRNTLSVATRGKQISWKHTSLAGEFYFKLSLGVRIDLYGPTALSDRLFVVDERRPSHRVVRELKSSTWPRQNPAVDGFTADEANKAGIDSLFVVGRNVYQAACGSSHSAMAYLRDFASRSAGIKEAKRKALLDGMLFEVFYNPDGKLRLQFKLRQFEPLFALQQHKELLPSFDFIAECLLPDAARFHVIPGKRSEVAIAIGTRPGSAPGHHVVENVLFGGADILWLEDEDYRPEPGKLPPVSTMSTTKFELELAEQMVVAPHLLTVNYVSISKPDKQRIEFPLGWTVRKG
jgi:hypothetical protein